MASMTQYCDWIAVDWGTSYLRVWAMAGDTVRASASSGKGMGALNRDGFEPALLDLIEPWLGQAGMDVLVCGMAGSRQGWVEAPYAAVPCAPLVPGFARPEVIDPRLSIHILPGLKQLSPFDVMRGEETQIAGFLHQTPGFDGVLCLPGTHTKWAQISAGEVIGFRTFMSGELFSLISNASILRHTVGPGWDDDAYLAAVSDAISKPQDLSGRLFSLRAEGLLSELDPAVARARISGLLIGAELAAARGYWLGQRLAVIGSGEQADAYAVALQAQGVTAERAEAQDMTLTGLTVAYSSLRETTS